MKKLKELLRAINKFFHDLTEKNWGAPYHFILAVWLMKILIIIGVAIEGAAVITFFTGIFYALYQLKKGTDTVSGAFQDWMFEIAAIFTVWFL